jgi:ribosomal protein S18 acetylase RimI-like enzyme
MDEIKRRPCTKEDYEFAFQLVEESLFPLVAEYYTPDEKVFRDRFEQDYQERIVLTVDEKPIGYYQLRTDGDRLEIKGIFLIKEYRGKGIGQKLMKEFETGGHKIISLTVWVNNPAVKFYKDLGYKIVGEKDHKYMMEKNL